MSNDVEEMAKLAEQIIAIGYETLKAKAPPGDKHYALILKVARAKLEWEVQSLLWRKPL
jgi:hypothetical protein